MKNLPTILALRGECEFSQEMRSRGFEVINLPMISTRIKSDLSFFKRIVESICEFEAIFITSRTAASAFANEVERSGKTDLPKVYALGERSRDVLAGRGIAIQYSETVHTANDLLDHFGEARFAEKRVLFICGDRSIRTIPDRLGRVATVVEAAVYETEEAVAEDKEVFRRVRSGEFGWACFFSPSAVDSYRNLQLPMGDSVRIATIGSTTADLIRSHGYNVDFVSEKANARYFAKSLADHIESFG